MNDSKKRVTSRSMRTGHSGKHNDRQFNIDHADHINDTRDNIYWNIYDGEYQTGGQHQYSFDEAEKKYYTEHYSDALELQNAKYKKNRQYKRCRTIDDILYNDKTGPDEMLLQIGSSKTGGTTRDTLINCVHEFIENVKQKYKQYHILNYAFHFDETSDHVHIRGVYDYTDKNGNLKVGQKEALKQMGIQCPNKGNEDTRYNNRKITFSQDLRSMWQQIVIAHGIDIETEPLEQGKIRIQTNQYKAEQEQKHYDELKKQVKDIQQAEGNLEQREQSIISWQDEIEQREQSLSQLEENINSREDIAFQKEQELNQRMESADAEIQRQTARIQSAQREADQQIQKQKEQTQKQLEALEQSTNEQIEKHKKDSQKRIEELKQKEEQQKIELESQNKELKSINVKLQGENIAYENRNNVLKTNNKDLKDINSNLQKDNAAYTKLKLEALKNKSQLESFLETAKKALPEVKDDFINLALIEADIRNIQNTLKKFPDRGISDDIER